MDFRQQFAAPSNRPAPAPAPAPVAPEHKEEKAGKSGKRRGDGEGGGVWGRWIRALSSILLIGVVVLLVGMIFSINRGTNGDNESKFVKSSNYQAVFLNNGQVYFGNITSLNNSYLRMTNIYYLTQQSSSSTDSSAAGNYSLVKLGCQQIHDPLDEMVINRSQVTFWENLNADGKVVSSIKAFIKQNPNGPDCSQVSSQTQASSSNNTQGSSGDTSTNATTNSTSK